jgi:hypothetical protein
MFRFEKEDIKRLRGALTIPDRVVYRNSTVARGTEGLCVVLR